MASTDTTATFSGHSNGGFQLASNSGHVQVNIHGQPDASPNKPKPCSTVPFRRDDDFVDRDILAEVGKICSKPAARAALVGLGGVGKSQLAIEYSYRIRERSPQTWLFWVHASNAARFEEGFRVIANRIKLPQRDEQTANVLQLVSSWLSDEANGQWVMILDNADDPTVFSNPCKGRVKSDTGDLVGGMVSLSTFLPQTPNGSILVTSRSKDAALRLTGSHQDIIEVEPMDEGRALLLLEKKLPGGFDKGDAIELVRTLDYMPLAISQAAAFINQRAPRTTLAKYLNDFRKCDRNRANLLNKDAGDLRRDREASSSIITTWQISFEYIRDKRPSAARLLSLMSFFDRQGIPESLLHHYDDRGYGSDIDLTDRTNQDLEDESDMEFEDDVFTLTSYSLITTNIENRKFEMHRLVQFSTRKWLELNGELEKWKEKFITTIWEAFPSSGYENWALCRVLFPHAGAVLGHQPAEKKYLVRWSHVLLCAGAYAATQGKYEAAEEMIRRALEETQKRALGNEHPDTLTSLCMLATVLYEQGKFEAAEEMFRRVLEAKEKVLGKEHPGTLTSAGHVASILDKQGNFEAAEEMNRQVLDGREKALGKEHPDTLACAYNLATVLHTQEKYEVAEEMIRRVLEGYEKVLGKEHPDNLASVGKLASVLHDQGKYEIADEMNRRVLEGYEKVLGKEHPDTVTSVCNLATVLHDQGKYEVAEEMNRRVLELSGKVLGKEHPETLKNVNNLAMALRAQGKYEAAEEMSRRALDGIEKVLGREHLKTLEAVLTLAYLLHQQKQYMDAMALYERACAGFQKVLGVDHATTRRCFRHYFSMIEEMKASSVLGS